MKNQKHKVREKYAKLSKEKRNMRKKKPKRIKLNTKKNTSKTTFESSQ